MGTYATVQALFTAICDAIRTKDGTAATIAHQDIPDRIAAIPTGGGSGALPYFWRTDANVRILVMIPYDYYTFPGTLRVLNKASVHIDWGDGESTDTPKQTKTTVVQEIDHMYASAGVYEITMTTEAKTVDNLIIAFEEPAKHGLVLGVSTDGQAKCSAVELYTGVTGMVRAVYGVSTSQDYGTSMQAGATFPASILEMHKSKPNISGNSAICKFYGSMYSGGGSYLLAYCKSLREVYLHDCFKIDGDCFGYDEALERVYIHDDGGPSGQSYYKIGSKAFENCTALKEVILDIKDRYVYPSLAADAFTNSGITETTGTIYVTDEYLDDMKTKTNWSTYADIMQPLSLYTGEEYHGYGN